MLGKISAHLRTGKQYNPLEMAVGSRRHTNDFIKKKILDVIHRRCGLEIVIAPLHTILGKFTDVAKASVVVYYNLVKENFYFGC